MTYERLRQLAKGSRVRLTYRHVLSQQFETVEGTVGNWRSDDVPITPDEPVMCCEALLIQPDGVGGLRATACPAGMPSWNIKVEEVKGTNA